MSSSPFFLEPSQWGRESLYCDCNLCPSSFVMEILGRGGSFSMSSNIRFALPVILNIIPEMVGSLTCSYSCLHGWLSFVQNRLLSFSETLCDVIIQASCLFLLSSWYFYQANQPSSKPLVFCVWLPSCFVFLCFFSVVQKLLHNSRYWFVFSVLIAYWIKYCAIATSSKVRIFWNEAGGW